jgi:hypothetical protein
MRIRDKQPGSYFLELRNHFFGCFGVKILKFLDADPGWRAKIEILIKLFLENVEIFHNYLKLPFFGLKIVLLFYRFVSDPVSDPDSNPDSNPDPKCLFRIRIGSGSGQKFRVLTDPDPQHCLQGTHPVSVGSSKIPSSV